PPRLCRWAVVVSDMARSPYQPGLAAPRASSTIYAENAWGTAKRGGRPTRPAQPSDGTPECQARRSERGARPVTTQRVELRRRDLRLVGEVLRPTPCRDDFQQLPQRLLGEGQEVPVALFGLER